MNQYVFARVDSNVNVRVNGISVTIHPGETRHDADPVVRAHPDLFTDQPTVIRLFPGWNPAPDVEQATAAPGEKRSTRRG